MRREENRDQKPDVEQMNRSGEESRMTVLEASPVE